MFFSGRLKFEYEIAFPYILVECHTLSDSPVNVLIESRSLRQNGTVSSNRIYKMHKITLIHVISTHCRKETASYYTIIAFQILSPICTFEDILKIKHLFRLFKTFSSRFKSVGTQDSPANLQTEVILLRFFPSEI